MTSKNKKAANNGFAGFILTAYYRSVLIFVELALP